MEFAKPKKSLGQNFLIDKNIIKKIISKIPDDKNLGIIEIGPGQGALTNFLVQKCKKLILIEIDDALAKNLQIQYQNNLHVKIINLDVLKVDFKDLALNEFSKCSKIYLVSNTPYNISSQILFKIFHANKYLHAAILMMQKEVVEKLSASTNSKQYSNLAVLTNFHADYEMITHVKNTAFYPKPKVDSVVFKLIIKPNVLPINLNEFHIFVRQCFQFKRKLLLNNLRHKGRFSVKAIEKLLSFLCLEKNVRAESISWPIFLKMFLFLFAISNETLFLKSNAKCTLSLNIKNKILNGYHDLEGIYAPYFDLNDEILINFEAIKTKIIVCNEKLFLLKNNIEKLLLVLKERKIFLRPIEIIIWKNIFPGWGLSGGSSNLYFVANEIFKFLNLKIENYLELLYEISTDSLFFHHNKICYVSNFGKKYLPINLANKQHPIFFIETNAKINFLSVNAYKLFDKLSILPETNSKTLILELIEMLKNNQLQKFYDNAYNDLLITALQNDEWTEWYKNLKNKLNKYKIILTGSGSSLICFRFLGKG